MRQAFPIYSIPPVLAALGLAVSCSSPKTKASGSPEESRSPRQAAAAVDSQMAVAALLDEVEEWHSTTNFSEGSWDRLIKAARNLQTMPPGVATRLLTELQDAHPNEIAYDTKLLLLLRVAFALPEDHVLFPQKEPRFRVAGWWAMRDSNIATNAAWPMKWNSGRPVLVGQNDMYQGQRWDAALEYMTFFNQVPRRDLSKSGK